MDRKLKLMKLELLKKYTDPKIGDIIKRLDVSKSAFYKSYISDERVDKVYLEVCQEIADLNCQIEEIKHYEKKQNFIKDNPETIKELFEGQQYISKEELDSKINDILKETEINH